MKENKSKVSSQENNIKSDNNLSNVNPLEKSLSTNETATPKKINQAVIQKKHIEKHNNIINNNVPLFKNMFLLTIFVSFLLTLFFQGKNQGYLGLFVFTVILSITLYMFLKRNSLCK